MDFNTVIEATAYRIIKKNYTEMKDEELRQLIEQVIEITEKAKEGETWNLRIAIRGIITVHLSMN